MGGPVTTVLYEEALDLDFLDELHAIPGGEKIKDCIQCGTCSGTCPVSWAMAETPRQLFAKIRAGMRDEVLASSTIWTCASCYDCAVHCPQEIKITDVMYELKRMALRENGSRGWRAEVLSRKFMETVNRYGRNHEASLLLRFMLATNPLGLLREAPMGWRLLVRGRLPLRQRPIAGIEGLRKALQQGPRFAR